MKIYTFVLLSSVSLTACAQVKYGSLVVILSDKNEIVVAGDSRVITPAGESDHRCKVSTLGNQMIFAATGATGDVAPAWDAHAIAHDLFVRFSRENTLQELPAVWGHEVEGKLRESVRRYGISAFDLRDNILANGYFVEFRHGSPSVTRVEILYKASPSGGFDTQVSVSRFETPQAFLSGHFELVAELFAGKTPRAIEWWKMIANRVHSGGDQSETEAIEAVRFTIQNIPIVKIGSQMAKPVGGPIDAVRLTPSGIAWIQRKPECQR